MSAELLTCPFCGQMKVFDGESAEKADHELMAKLACDCDRAKKFQTRYNKAQWLVSNIHALFGEECKEMNPVWDPIPDECMKEIVRLAEAVAFEKIESAAVVFQDGTKVKITYTSVERNRSYKSKLG